MKTDSEAMGALFDALADEFKSRILSGTADAATMNGARQFLKDNGISCVPTESNPLGGLTKALPSFPDEDAEAVH